jgi:hypothetical protein
LVEWRKDMTNRFAGGTAARSPRYPAAGSIRKAAINGVLTQFYLFMKYLRLGSMVAGIASESDRRLGIPER